MAVSITSIEAFETITKDGTRMTQKEIVHNAIKKLWSNMGFLAPTRREVTKFTGLETSACTARINELMHDNKIVQMPKRKCNTTGKRVFPVVSIEHRKDAMERLISRCFDDYLNDDLPPIGINGKDLEVKYSHGSLFGSPDKSIIRFGYWNQIPVEMKKHIEKVTNTVMLEMEIEGPTEDKNAEYLYIIEW